MKCDDDAADTLRMRPFDPEGTAIYDLRDMPTPVNLAGRTSAARRRRRIRETQQEIAGLRAALAAGWDVGPELAYEERRLVTLKAAERRSSL